MIDIKLDPKSGVPFYRQIILLGILLVSAGVIYKHIIGA
jgi:hypothetical protein